MLPAVCSEDCSVGKIKFVPRIVHWSPKRTARVTLYTIYLFYFILTLIWLVSYTELQDTCLFSQKTFEGIKTETWVRLENYLQEYTVSGENKMTEMISFLARVGVLS